MYDRVVVRGCSLALGYASYSVDTMPPKVRELIADLKRAGFVDRGGKGSHRNFVHPAVPKPVTLSGNRGDDAKQYQIRAVESAIAEVKE